jgi:hypothetical protein
MGLLVPLRGRDHRAATVGVPQKLLAASHTHNFEPGAKQSSDEPLHLQAELDSFPDSLEEGIQGFRLAVASAKRGNGRHIVAGTVTLDDDVELSHVVYSTGLRSRRPLC